jgi:hypothetical protein
MVTAHPGESVDSRTPVRRTRELALSAAWHGGLTRSLVDTDGRTINVVFAGHWSHGFGPDFTGAMLEMPDGGLVTGAVELHHDASDWTKHGHHLDPRYNSVVLHVVSRADVAETLRADGSGVPMAVLTVPDEVLFRIDARLPEIWSELGGDVCAAGLAVQEPQKVVHVLQRLGDERLHERVTRIEGDLHVSAPREILTRMLLEAMGYSENRQPMLALADQLNRNDWSRCLSKFAIQDRADVTKALLFGVGGFLPLSPTDAHLAGLEPAQVKVVEDIWDRLHPALDVQPIATTAWVRARTRPANHPAARLATTSLLLASLVDDPVGDLLRAIREAPDVAVWLRQLTLRSGRSTLGESRARAVTASVAIPLAIAIARQSGDSVVEDAASMAWDRLRASEWSRPAKRALHQVAGDITLRGLGERGQQGLLKLDRDFCQPRRCFECPVAAEVVREQIRLPR